MKVELSRRAKCALEDIADWIAADSPRRAVKFIRELRAEFQRIGDGPLLYQRRPDIGVDARLATVGRYVILFWTDTSSDVVRVERVVYGARDLSRVY